MSRNDLRIEKIQKHIQALALEETQTKEPLKRAWCFTRRWFLMLYNESVKDHVKVRAESLAFLMIFSLLPLIAGLFFIFTFFAQFGMVQEALSSLTEQFLGNIPSEHREIVATYVLKFKDAYLASISGKSGQFGIFALAILIWAGLQTFNNIDQTINYIWSSEHDRPFMEKARNFIVVAVAAPLVIIASLSIPIMLKRFGPTKQLLTSLPWLFNFMNFMIPVTLVLATFTLLYRFVPVRKVQWSSAFVGATFSAIVLQLANIGMRFYFRVGTNSAYGKAAVVPLLGFWLYIVWMIVIAGAEVSYLSQNERYIVRAWGHLPSIYEGESLMRILSTLNKNHAEGKGPVPFPQLFQETHLETGALRRILGYLQSQNYTVPSLATSGSGEMEFVLARDLSRISIRDLLQDYLIKSLPPDYNQGPLGKDFAASLEHWLSYFDKKSIGDYLS